MTPENAELTARAISDARLHRQPLGPLPDPLQPADEAQAYHLQTLANRHLSESGLGPVAGYKIGCTTAVMQAYLGIPSPCAGAIFQRTIAQQGAPLDHAAYRRPGVECEIAVRLGSDIPADTPQDRHSIAAFVEAVMPAAEIVDDRYTDWRTVGTPLLIADNFFGAGCVLGNPLSNWPALDQVAGTMVINGTTVGQGRGADVLGHPFEALAWLANGLATRGNRLKAGDLILTGSVVQTNWVAAGDRIVMDLGPLGSVECSFTA